MINLLNIMNSLLVATGDSGKPLLVAICLIVSIVLMVFLIITGKKQDDDDSDDTE